MNVNARPHSNDCVGRNPDIRAMRHDAQLSQQALAQLAGCSIGQLALLERGYTPHRSAVRDRVLDALRHPTGEAA